MKRLVVKSYAKINLALNVLKKREDGYHELDTIMLPLELHDSILMNKLTKGGDTFITCDDFSIGVLNYNIATTAINKLSEVYNVNAKFRVFIHKVIPLQSGLGGGSSNAAYSMLAVNQLMKLNADKKTLLDIAKTLGADVPFFINCVPSRCQGIGEIITPIEVKNNYYILIVCPKLGCSTKEVFLTSDTMTLKTYPIDDVVVALASGDDELLAKSIGNSLLDAASLLNPEITEIIELLRGYGLKIVSMTGSGSAVFAMSQDKKLLKRIEKNLEDKYRVELTRIKK